jgi:hypothetical protein
MYFNAFLNPGYHPFPTNKRIQTLVDSWLRYIKLITSIQNQTNNISSFCLFHGLYH